MFKWHVEHEKFIEKIIKRHESKRPFGGAKKRWRIT
jgi:hypothetical protein